MDTYPLLVGFSFAIGMGLIANATLSTLHDFGRRFAQALFRKQSRLLALGLTSAKEKEEHDTEDVILGLANIPWTNLYAATALAAPADTQTIVRRRASSRSLSLVIVLLLIFAAPFPLVHPRAMLREMVAP